MNDQRRRGLGGTVLVRGPHLGFWCHMALHKSLLLVPRFLHLLLTSPEGVICEASGAGRS